MAYAGSANNDGLAALLGALMMVLLVAGVYVIINLATEYDTLVGKKLLTAKDPQGKLLFSGPVETKEDLDKLKGKIAGKFLLVGDVKEFKPHEQAQFERYDDKSLAGVSQFEMPRAQAFNREAAVKRRQLFLDTLKLFADEKPLGVIVPGGSDFGTIHVQSAGSQRPNEQYPVPSVVVSDEQYERIVRLLDHKKEPELELDVKAKYYDDNPNQYNTVAEIPGTAKNGEVVMLGAHLDSWHSGTGATDNGAGTVAVMEAVRILKAIGIAPKRTIRIALWSGEEEGLLGSHGYVAQHFGSKPLLL